MCVAGCGWAGNLVATVYFPIGTVPCLTTRVASGIHLPACGPVRPAVLSSPMRRPGLLRYLILVAVAAAFLSFLHYGFGYMDYRNFEKSIGLFVVIAILGVAWYAMDLLVRRIFRSQE